MALQTTPAMRILCSLLVVLIASSCLEGMPRVSGFVPVSRGVVRHPSKITTTCLPALRLKRFWKNKNEQRQKQQDHLQPPINEVTKGGRPMSRRQRLWRNMAAVFISVAAATVGRRGFATANAAHPADEVWMTSVVTSKQQIEMPASKTLPTAKSMRGAVLVAAGAGAVLGWNLVQVEKSTSPAVEGVGAGSSDESSGSSAPPRSLESVPQFEDETSRLRAQKFVEGVLSRIKDAQRKAFHTLSTSPSSSSSTPEVGSASYLESLSASAPKTKTSPLIRTKPVTPKQPPIGTSYLDSLATKFSRVGQDVATSSTTSTPTTPAAAAVEKKPVVVDDTPTSVAFATRPRRTTTSLVTGTNPLKSWSVVKRQRNWDKARQQPKPPAEEEMLAQKYASLSVPDRAYQILVDLGMVEPTGDGMTSSDDDSEEA